MRSWEDTEKMDKLLKDERFRAVCDAVEHIKELGTWAEEINNKLPPLGSGSLIHKRLYLETQAIHILTITYLEYALKSVGKISNQNEIIGIIKNSSLEKLEKERLIQFFLRRHPSTHKAGHADEGFLKKMDKENFEFPALSFKKDSITTMTTRDYSSYTKIIFKMLQQDVLKDFDIPDSFKF